MSTLVQTPNAEAIAAWDGPLYDRFVQFRKIVTDGLGVHGEQALRLHPPRRGERVLDIGCGFGDTTQRLAALVGPEGEAVGIDAAGRFIDTAREEAEEAGVENAAFEVADVQQVVPGGPYEMAFSRFGTMFFANPVVALRNIRLTLAPGGPLVMVVWRRRIDNDWIYRAQTIVEQIATRPEEYDEPTCGPGPFSMADADTTTAILKAAGYTNITLHRCDEPITIGKDVDEAIEFLMALGPAGEILRLQGDRAAHLHDHIRAALASGLAALTTPAGVIGDASTWIISAINPGDDMPDTTDPLAVARRYADAYAAFDTSELADVLAPNLRFRQVNPGGYLELDSARAYIDATGQFLDTYDTHRSAGASAQQMGDRFLTTSRIQLHRDRGPYLMQHSEIVTVADGKVIQIDSVCTGARPS
jgi:ubiquinone/menaquinone biosynthesis C-methylase UbiE